ncbi:Hypothetical predicted protein [Podarcis lilfordi]|uniref:Uncharacterized protein n=1 Tax=Podarcis lilfordi TaxID=74358 RepID=A0AA35PRL2_9SAUR|nr:Hypothetical predicted protein [Podarcis lilfordi]
MPTSDRTAPKLPNLASGKTKELGSAAVDGRARVGCLHRRSFGGEAGPQTGLEPESSRFDAEGRKEVVSSLLTPPTPRPPQLLLRRLRGVRAPHPHPGPIDELSPVRKKMMLFGA